MLQTIPSSVSAQAHKAGLDLVLVGDRVEARQGKRVISFHVDPVKALSKALERMEETRLREMDKLPSDREPVLHIPPKKKSAAPSTVTFPSPPAPPYTEAEIGEAVAKTVKQSIIKSKYKDRYKPNGGSCGDFISEELRTCLVKIVNGRAQ